MHSGMSGCARNGHLALFHKTDRAVRLAEMSAHLLSKHLKNKSGMPGFFPNQSVLSKKSICYARQRVGVKKFWTGMNCRHTEGLQGLPEIH
jgi:hypothetical protein